MGIILKAKPSLAGRGSSTQQSPGRRTSPRLSNGAVEVHPQWPLLFYSSQSCKCNGRLAVYAMASVIEAMWQNGVPDCNELYISALQDCVSSQPKLAIISRAHRHSPESAPEQSQD